MQQIERQKQMKRPAWIPQNTYASCITNLTPPDSKVFEILMGRIQSFDETSYFGEELEDWVYHEMNRTYSREIEAWFMPRVESRRQSRADLRAWISRWKQGFGGTRYNIRTMWAGRESMLDANFVAMCEAVGGIE